ncbi:hypothetical protein XENORESO_003274, partial [Xenotaenia resolanae]
MVERCGCVAFKWSEQNVIQVRMLADGRLNSGHAGVLLAERRGSYPPIDLQILK